MSGVSSAQKHSPDMENSATKQALFNASESDVDDIVRECANLRWKRQKTDDCSHPNSELAASRALREDESFANIESNCVISC